MIKRNPPRKADVRTFISFVEVENPGKRTRIWNVVSTHSGGPVGQVRWRGQWRKYVFFPEPDTLFDHDCMRLIADFTERKTDNHRYDFKR